MLSSLPPELLRKVIESTVPHTFHSSTYRDRQSTLRSLSLVSRTLRAIAQPLLLEIVYFNSDEEIKLLLETRENHTGIQELIAGSNPYADVVEEFLRRWKGFQSVSIERLDHDPIDLKFLVRHTSKSSDLSTLNLEEVPTCSSSVAALVNLQLIGSGFHYTAREPLTSLQSLTLDFRALDSSVPLLLDPEVLPSLQALGLNSVTNDEELRQLGATNLSRLLPQLDAIGFPSSLYRLGISSLFSGYSSRILVDIHYRTLALPGLLQSLAFARHIRIQDSKTFSFKASAATLNLLAVCRESENSSLGSIYLPLEWHPSRVQSTDIMTEMQQVIKEGEKAGVEVVFESQSHSYLDYYVSREFWARQRKTRKEEQKRRLGEESRS
ncbi:uncharacterized protein JCM6883_007335 [Sporobolomyces salmoneus]|uniref:uncharacterized protein n=1 Tax=Sporobolomyces salmoneus TaxID=183962 RepID=UPI003175909C